MGNKADDPVDHSRTTRRHAGQNMKNTKAMPGIFAGAVAVVAFVVGLFAFATAHASLGTVAIAAAVVLAIGASAWLARERRRVRRVEEQFHDEHPEVPQQPPAS